jgi:hypothetical protein
MVKTHDIGESGMNLQKAAMPSLLILGMLHRSALGAFRQPPLPSKELHLDDGVRLRHFVEQPASLRCCILR